MFSFKSSRLKLNRSSSMRSIPEGSEEEHRIRNDWNLRRTLSDFINNTYAPTRNKVASNDLSSSQTCPATDVEPEASDEDDTEVEDEGCDQVISKCDIEDTSIKIVGYLLKDGTYIDCVEGSYKSRPSLTPVTDLSLEEETVTPTSASLLSPITEMTFAEQMRASRPSVASITESEPFTKLKPSHGDKSKCYEHLDNDESTRVIHDEKNTNRSTNNVNNTKLLKTVEKHDNNNKESIDQSLIRSFNLMNINVSENENDVFRNSPEENVNENLYKVKYRVSRIEKKLSDPNSPDFTEIDFDQLFSDEKVMKRNNDNSERLFKRQSLIGNDNYEEDK